MSTLFLHLFLFLLHIILLSRLLLPRWIQTKLRHHLFATPPPSSATSSSPAAFDSVEPVPKTGKNPFPLTLLPKYDVFISFRGEDVRDTFLSHLYSHLSDNKKVCAYKDDRDLGRGEQISASLVEAIERSTVYLVIFSPNYANSRWCLEELVKILDCSRRYGRKVIPVFYGGSDPSQVRNQTGSYADAFARRYRNLPVEKVQGWRAALREAANISGFDSRITRPETDLIKEISKAVVERMHSQMMLPSNATYGLVGVEKSMRAIGLSLCIETEANWTIGLCGMGGIGKTTLAKAIYDQFSNQFEASCFVSNFADHLSRLPQLFDGLQNELFSRLLPNENGYSIPASFKLNRLRRIKALIVIDDVDNIKQLEDLFDRRYCDLFGPGSRILLTSRNKQLLKNVCHQIYEVNPLDDNESLQLFCLHAFKEDHPPPGYLWASNLAITYASGNPLALKVLGSNLYGRNKEFWDCELNMLRNRPDEDVKNVVLRRSYDGLNEVEKSAYLDIACFYDPWGSTYDMLGKFEEKVLDGCYAEYGGSCNLVTKLVDKSLLSIGDSLGIQMHRLLQDLGRNIVNEERSVGKRSRLWEAKDIYNLLIQKKGSESVEVIVWNLCEMQYEAGEICVDSDAFRNLENLRILAIYNYDALPELVLPEDGLECLPETLRCLYWDFFPSRWFGSKFSPQNLVSLDLRHSNIEQLWEGAHNVDLGNLKYLNLRESQHLSKLPSFSTAKKLEWIDLEYCESLVELPLSIFYLPRLEVLLLRYCTSLNLTDLVGRYREEIGSQILPNLKKLDITGTATQKIPDFFCHSQIVELHCDNCPDMTEFPVIPSVKALSLSGTLIQGPIEVEFLYGLKELTCTDNRHLLCLSNGFCDLKSLERIDLSGCSQLKEFPDIMEPMGALLSVRLTGCSNLSTLPDSICNLTHLGELDLQNSGITELPSSIGDLIHLWHLGLACCTSLTTLPNTIHKLCKLVRLDLSNCILLTQLPELPSSLEHLNAHGCRSLRTVSCIEKHNLCTGKWSFGNCPELDPKSFRELVAKFTRDVEECHLRVPQKPTIILPAEGAMGEARRSSVLVELRQTWRLKGLIYWALLDFSCLVNIASAGVYRGHTLPGKYHVDCSIRNGGVDDGGREDIVSRCELEAAVDDLAGGDGNRLLIMWYEDGFNGISFEGGEDENTTIFVEFFFRAGFPVRSKRMEMSNPIMSCGVLWQVYDDRVTYLS